MDALKLKQAYEQIDAQCKALAADLQAAINYDDLLGENKVADEISKRLNALSLQRETAFQDWQQAQSNSPLSYFESDKWDA